jgi:hypothetical protein
VVDMAHDQRVSVGELMTKMVLDLRGAKSDSQPSHASNTAVDADRLLKLLQAAATLPKADLPKADKNAIRATIASELRLLHRDHPAPESQKE